MRAAFERFKARRAKRRLERQGRREDRYTRRQESGEIAASDARTRPFSRQRWNGPGEGGEA